MGPFGKKRVLEDLIGETTTATEQFSALHLSPAAERIATMLVRAT